MNAALKTITERVPPPQNPVNVEGDWESVEQRLGFGLPADYKEFVSLYGSGCFDPLELFVWNLQVVEPDTEFIIDQHAFARCADDPTRKLGELVQSAPIFPWGEGIETTLFWVQHGEPDAWHVLVSTDMGLEFHEFREFTTTRFLLDLLLAQNPAITDLWSPDCFSDPQVFLPATK